MHHARNTINQGYESSWENLETADSWTWRKSPSRANGIFATNFRGCHQAKRQELQQVTVGNNHDRNNSYRCASLHVLCVKSICQILDCLDELNTQISNHGTSRWSTCSRSKSISSLWLSFYLPTWKSWRVYFPPFTNVPEIYDLMEKVPEIAVASQSPQVQELYCGVLQFLLDYPQGKGRYEIKCHSLLRIIS